MTVAFCSNLTMVFDKVSGARNDLTVSPVRPAVLSLSYYLATFCTTLLINGIAAAACFGYLGLTLLASVLSDLLKKELMLYGAGVVCLGVAATVARFVLPPVFREYNVSYVLMSLFVISLLFYGFAVVNSFVKKNIPYVNSVGKSLLFFFVLTYGSTFLSRQLIKAPLTLAGCILLSCIIFTVYCFIAGELERRNIVIKL